MHGSATRAGAGWTHAHWRDCARDCGRGGQFAVQLAKAAGNHVIATCSNPSKVALLKRLGADRVINYRQESLKAVLKQEYPSGVNLIYESVSISAGELFRVCTRQLPVAW